MMDVVRLEDFGLRIGEKQIYKHASLRLPARGCVVLLGPSGTGKSTLLRTLAGQIQLHPQAVLEGQLTVHGLTDLAEGETPRPPVLVEQKAELLMASVWESLVSEWPRRSSLTQAEQKVEMAKLLERWGQGDLQAHWQTSLISLSKGLRNRVAIVRKALANAPLLMVDEPTAGLRDESPDAILALLKTLANETALLVVTHHQQHARALADEIVLVASGKVQEQTPAAQFFAGPASECGRQFLLTGSCAEEPIAPEEEELAEASETVVVEPVLSTPEPARVVSPPVVELPVVASTQQPAPQRPEPVETPTLAVPSPRVDDKKAAPDTALPFGATHRWASALSQVQLDAEGLWGVSDVPTARLQQPGPRGRGPRGFTWILESQLAGTPWPGVVSDCDEDLSALCDAGITHLISLTELPFPAAEAGRYQLSCSALPMPDMSVPSLADGLALCRWIDRLFEAGHVVAVHCRAGLGRTGTMLAMYWIWRQKGTVSADQSIRWVRGRNSGMIQSVAQETFLEEFARGLPSVLAENQPAF